MKKSQLTLIDLFAGVGGLSYGFAHDPHFKILAANEILPNMAKAYALNHPGVKVYHDDIKNITAARVQKDLNLKSGEVDIVVGGPPCQAYSTVGKRWLDDPRAFLFREYYRILKEFKPKFFLYENVKGLISMQNGTLLPSIIELFGSLGYKIQYKLLNAADYGAPQIRERVIVVGTKLKSKFEYPLPTHRNPATSPDLFSAKLKPWITLGEALGDLPLIKSGEESFSYATMPQNDFQKEMRKNAGDKVFDHNAPNNNARLVKIMETLPEGGGPDDLPNALKPTSGFKNTYSRLWWDRPSTTVTRNLSTPSSSRCIHPRAPRPLTTREGARLQCFPDTYVFCGSRSDKNLQIGNAVPTRLSTALARSILDAFKREGLV